MSKEIELKIFFYQFSLADCFPITGHVTFSRELFVYHLTIIYSYARHNLKFERKVLKSVNTWLKLSNKPLKQALFKMEVA